MSSDAPQPLCTCGHTQNKHTATRCTGNTTGPCQCAGWTPAPDATTDPFSRGWREQT